MATCAHCGHTTRVKAPKLAPAIEANESLEALKARYKRTAPYHDLQFLIARSYRMPSDWREIALSLLALVTPDGALSIGRSEFYRRLGNLQDDARRESNTRDCALVRYVWRDYEREIITGVAA